LKPGPILAKKYHFADEHLGFLAVKGRPGICYDYGAEGPDGTNTSGPIAGVPAGKTRDRMQWIANRYWADAQKSDNAAAAYKSAINRIRSAEFRSDWAKSYVGQLKPGHASVITLSDRMLAESARFAGPAKVTLTFSKPAPGGVGAALAKVTQAGNPLPGCFSEVVGDRRDHHERREDQREGRDGEAAVHSRRWCGVDQGRRRSSPSGARLATASRPTAGSSTSFGAGSAPASQLAGSSIHSQASRSPRPATGRAWASPRSRSPPRPRPARSAGRRPSAARC
jgi:hypothetical protein